MIPVTRVRAQPGVRRLLLFCCEWQAVTYWPAAVVADVTGLNQVAGELCVWWALKPCSHMPNAWIACVSICMDVCVLNVGNWSRAPEGCPTTSGIQWCVGGIGWGCFLILR